MNDNLPMNIAIGNPLLDAGPLPAFHAIKPEHMEPAIDALLAELRAAPQRLLGKAPPSGRIRCGHWRIWRTGSIAPGRR